MDFPSTYQFPTIAYQIHIFYRLTTIFTLSLYYCFKIKNQTKCSQQSLNPTVLRNIFLRLGSLKPYAFVVLAVKQNRQGPASDPPVYIDQIKPVYNVQNLRLQYKTSQSVQFQVINQSSLKYNLIAKASFQWDYVNPEPDKPIGFYVKQMGEKHYYDQNLVDKNMVSPGFERKVDGTERSMLWPSLRPYMNYTFQVGVYSLQVRNSFSICKFVDLINLRSVNNLNDFQDGRQFWPAELTVRTDPIGKSIYTLKIGICAESDPKVRHFSAWVRSVSVPTRCVNGSVVLQHFNFNVTCQH